MSQEQDQYQIQIESKASDSVRIAEPVATSGANQEPSQLTDDMIEGVSSRSVAISARSETEDMTTRAISSPENRVIPYTVITDVSARITRTNLSHDSVDSVRIAESDSDGSGRPDLTAQWRSLTEETNATGPLEVAYEGIRQLVTLADRHKKGLRVARHEVRTAKAELRCAQNVLVD